MLEKPLLSVPKFVLVLRVATSFWCVEGVGGVLGNLRVELLEQLIDEADSAGKSVHRDLVDGNEVSLVVVANVGVSHLEDKTVGAVDQGLAIGKNRRKISPASGGVGGEVSVIDVISILTSNANAILDDRLGGDVVDRRRQTSFCIVIVFWIS